VPPITPHLPVWHGDEQRRRAPFPSKNPHPPPSRPLLYKRNPSPQCISPSPHSSHQHHTCPFATAREEEHRERKRKQEKVRERKRKLEEELKTKTAPEGSLGVREPSCSLREEGEKLGARRSRKSEPEKSEADVAISASPTPLSAGTEPPAITAPVRLLPDRRRRLHRLGEQTLLSVAIRAPPSLSSVRRRVRKKTRCGPSITT
jgi:hypothetical protein